jgi:hypothetical protein
MKEQRITIEIDEDGQLRADAEGFTGDLCVKDLEKILEGLGGEPVTQRKQDDGARRAARTVTVGGKR